MGIGQYLLVHAWKHVKQIIAKLGNQDRISEETLTEPEEV